MRFKYNTTISLKQNAYDLVNVPPYFEIYLVEDFKIPGRSGSYNMIATSAWELNAESVFVAYMENTDAVYFCDQTFTRYIHLDAKRIPEVVVIRKLPYQP